MLSLYFYVLILHSIDYYLLETELVCLVERSYVIFMIAFFFNKIHVLILSILEICRNIFKDVLP